MKKTGKVVYVCNKCGKEREATEQETNWLDADDSAPMGWLRLSWPSVNNVKYGMTERIDLCETCFQLMDDWLHNKITRQGPADAE